MTKQEFLLSHPYYRVKEEERIGKIKEYFTNLRYKIFAPCIPSIYVHNGEIDWVYPEYIQKAFNYINDIERLYLKND